MTLEYQVHFPPLDSQRWAMTELKLGCSGVHFMASRGLQGPGLNVIHCMEPFRLHDKCHLLNKNFTLYFDTFYWFSWHITSHGNPSPTRWRVVSECFYSYLVILSPFVYHHILFCSILAVRAETRARWLLQLPSLDMPSCLVLTQLFRWFARAAKGAITQFSNTLWCTLKFTRR